MIDAVMIRGAGPAETSVEMEYKKRGQLIKRWYIHTSMYIERERKIQNRLARNGFVIQRVRAYVS